MTKSLSGIVASEAGSVEKPALVLLAELGWSPLNLQDEVCGPQNPTGRSSFRQAHLPARLRAALKRLNPFLPEEALRQAETALTIDRSAMLPVRANREVLTHVVEGVPVQIKRPDGKF